VFVPCKLFQSRLMFVGKTRAYPSEAKGTLLALPTNIFCLAWKRLSGTNALAYNENSQKVSMIENPGALNAIQFISARKTSQSCFVSPHPTFPSCILKEHSVSFPGHYLNIVAHYYCMYVCIHVCMCVYVCMHACM